MFSGPVELVLHSSQGTITQSLLWAWKSHSAKLRHKIIIRFNSSYVYSLLTADELSFLMLCDFKLSQTITVLSACMFIVTNPGFTLAGMPFRQLSSAELSESEQQCLRGAKSREKVIASSSGNCGYSVASIVSKRASLEQNKWCWGSHIYAVCVWMGVSLK